MATSSSNFADEPQEALVAGMVFVALGLIFAGVGFGFYAYERRRREKINRLIAEGDCYDAEIINSYPDPYQSINFRSPVILECWYRDKSDKTYAVKSSGIWLDTALIKDGAVKVKVYVNKDNPREYHVDVNLDSGNGPRDIKFDYDFR